MISRLAPLALRSMLRNRRRSAFTLGAVSLGVAVVIFGGAFGAGLLNVMIQLSVESRTGAMQVNIDGYSAATEISPLKLDLPAQGEALERLRTVPGVTAVSRRIRLGGMISNGRTQSMVLVMAMDPAEEDKVTPARAQEVPKDQGTHLRADKPNGVVVGAELASAFGVKVGDSLVLTAAGPGGGINALDVEVVGITRGSTPMEGKRIMNMNLSYAQELLGMEERVTTYVVAVDQLRNIETVASRVRAALGPKYEVSTWQDVVPLLRDMVFRLGWVLRGISIVLFVLVMFGIVNTMLMSVYERVKEIGTMLALGLKRRHIMTLFLLEAGFLGLLGGMIGALIGMAITLYTNQRGLQFAPPGSLFTQLIRPEVSFVLAAAAVLGASAGAVLAAAWPARKAGLMNPVEALRTA